MSVVLVAAPHPDDETLGCAGRLLRHRQEGDRLHWLIFTEMRVEFGYAEELIEARAGEISAVAEQFGFASVHQLGFAPASLDVTPLRSIVERVSSVVTLTEAEILYAPHRGDAHSDHTIAFDALAACTKWFRFPTIKRVLAYETMSETDASIAGFHAAFVPNVFYDITAFLDEKVAIMKRYRSQFGNLPFPRSEGGLRALAAYRGAASGFEAAEAFMLLRERS